MPLYEVEHICTLSPSQQDALATAITTLHAEKFSAPRIFVNVRFTDISQHALYVAGKRKRSNRILAHVRHGPSRTQKMFDELCASLNEAWTDIVGAGTKSDEDVELRAIFVMGSIVAGAEAGFPLPAAGGDMEWLRENMAVFEERARAGDGEFVDLVEEVRGRECFKGVIGG